MSEARAEPPRADPAAFSKKRAGRGAFPASFRESRPPKTKSGIGGEGLGDARVRGPPDRPPHAALSLRRLRGPPALGPSTRTLFPHSRDRVCRLRATRVIMKLGVSIQLLCELAPYALVGTTVFTAALGAPYLASLTGLVTLFAARGHGAQRVRPRGSAARRCPTRRVPAKVVWITGASQGLGEAAGAAPGRWARRIRAAGARRASGCARRATRSARARRGRSRWTRAGRRRRARRRRRRWRGPAERGADAGVGIGLAPRRGARSRARRRIPPRRWTATCSRSTSSARSRSRRRCCPACSRGRRGVIAAVCSMAAKCPAPGQAAYSATKAALAAFLHALRGETADRGVRACVAHPRPDRHRARRADARGVRRARWRRARATRRKMTSRRRGPAASRVLGKTKSGWTRGGRRRASRRARLTGWTR